MPEPLKNMINRDVIKAMAQHFELHCSGFNKPAFIKDAAAGLDQLELKQRTDQLTQALIRHFPADFEDAGQLMLSSLGSPLSDKISAGAVTADGIAGWAIMPLVNFVALQGQTNFDFSMTLLKELTKRSSAEFGIRVFILERPSKTMDVLKQWAKDEDMHVRRLASEGCRPRLPWSMQLPMFIEDPIPIIEILEILKDDESEYVRRSVANNLNDIAKDHPDKVASIAQRWLQGASKDRVRLVKHACRTLLKNGHPQTMSALGYKPALLDDASLTVVTPQVEFGGALEFSLELKSSANVDQALMIDYIIHHRKANGKTSPKVFKWRITSLLKSKPLSITKNHRIKEITTRTYYAGTHSVEVVINGEPIARSDFELLM